MLRKSKRKPKPKKHSEAPPPPPDPAPPTPPSPTSLPTAPARKSQSRPLLPSRVSLARRPQDKPPPPLDSQARKPQAKSPPLPQSPARRPQNQPPPPPVSPPTAKASVRKPLNMSPPSPVEKSALLAKSPARRPQDQPPPPPLDSSSPPLKSLEDVPPAVCFDANIVVPPLPAVLPLPNEPTTSSTLTRRFADFAVQNPRRVAQLSARFQQPLASVPPPRLPPRRIPPKLPPRRSSTPVLMLQPRSLQFTSSSSSSSSSSLVKTDDALLSDDAFYDEFASGFEQHGADKMEKKYNFK